MYSIDRDNFKEFLKKFPEQITQGKEIFQKSGVKLDTKKIKNIIFLGMGGSAIAGDIYRNTFFDELKYPMQIIRGYHCPGSCSEDSLVIVSSYSGNTEETVAAALAAHEKGGQIVAIASGGKIAELAGEKKWPLLTIPGGFPPRQAFGYSFFPLIYLLNPLLKTPVAESHLDRVLHLVHAMIHRNDEMTAEGKSLSKNLAINIHNRIPIIYTTAPYLESVALRWKNQFQENAKSMAFHNALPEMNHNEIVGWELEHKCMENFIVIFLEGQNTHPRIRARVDLTKNIIHERGAEIASIYAEGDTALEQVVSLILKGDWVSYYLALLYEKNPASILNIDYLKSELEKI